MKSLTYADIPHPASLRMATRRFLQVNLSIHTFYLYYTLRFYYITYIYLQAWTILAFRWSKSCCYDVVCRVGIIVFFVGDDCWGLSIKVWCMTCLLPDALSTSSRLLQKYGQVGPTKWHKHFSTEKRLD